MLVIHTLFRRTIAKSLNLRALKKVNILAESYASSSLSKISTDERFFSTSNKLNEGVYDKISFIGAGKMAEALISPLIETGIQPAKDISIFDVSQKTMDHVCEKYDGVQATSSVAEVLDDSDLVILAVKPQNLSKLFEEFSESSLSVKDMTLLSIVAGKPISSLVQGTGITKIARSMPNTPAQIGRGVTVWCCTDQIQLNERAKIKRILHSFGKAVSHSHFSVVIKYTN